MPLISTKGVYGLAAIYELSKHKDDTPMQIKDISANASIPQNYLEQLLSKLRRADLVKSVRGARGGYTLAKSDARNFLFECNFLFIPAKIAIFY